jgi:hypothetical protein
MTIQKPSEWDEQYIGDAVYVSFDGHQLKLRTGDGGNQVIFMEPQVYFSLINYVDRLSKAKINIQVDPTSDESLLQ